MDCYGFGQEHRVLTFSEDQNSLLGKPYVLSGTYNSTYEKFSFRARVVAQSSMRLCFTCPEIEAAQGGQTVKLQEALKPGKVSGLGHTVFGQVSSDATPKRG